MLFRTAILVALFLGISSSTYAQTSQTEALLNAIDRMCRQEVPERNTGQIVEFDGAVGAGGVARFFGFEAEGSISVEQYDILNSQLKGLRRNTDDCKFDAFKLLKPVFIDGVSETEFDAVVDRCQSSGNLKVCVKTQELRLFGSNLRVPITFESVDGKVVMFIYEATRNEILTDTGENFPQGKDPAQQVRINAGEKHSDVFTAKLGSAENVSEIALEVTLRQPKNTSLFFDKIFIR